MRDRNTVRVCLAALAVLALVANGCAGGQPTSAPSSDPPAASESTEPAAVGEQPAPKQQSPLESVTAAAKTEGKVVWYESSPEEDAAKIIKVFNERHPEIEVEQVRLRGSEAATRVMTESQAGQATADVVTAVGEGPLLSLRDRGFVATVNWRELGIDNELIRGDISVSTAAPMYVLLYNTDLVPAAEAPKSWEDLLDPRWKGKVGMWVQPYALTYLVPTWGEERALDYVRKLKQQELVYFQSTFPLAAAVGAGEIPVGIGIYHGALPTVEQGAPLKIVFPNPTGVTLLNSWVTAKAPHPNAARLFITWLASPEGAKAYDDATKRGSPFVAGTKPHELVRTVEVSAFPFEQAAQEDEWLGRFAQELGLK